MGAHACTAGASLVRAQRTCFVIWQSYVKKSFPFLAAATAALRRGTADSLNISHVFRPASASSAPEKASSKVVLLPKAR